MQEQTKRGRDLNDPLILRWRSSGPRATGSVPGTGSTFLQCFGCLCEGIAHGSCKPLTSAGHTLHGGYLGLVSCKDAAAIFRVYYCYRCSLKLSFAAIRGTRPFYKLDSITSYKREVRYTIRRDTRASRCFDLLLNYVAFSIIFF